MITAKFYAALKNNQFTLDKITPDIFNAQEFYKNIDKIKNAEPIFNYANFFDKGIDLYDNSLILGDENDYYGLVGDPIEIIVYLLNSDLSYIKNGITFFFDKFSCSKIGIYEDVYENFEHKKGRTIFEAEIPDNFTLKTHLTFDIPEGLEDCTVLYITLSNTQEVNHYITLQGMTLGKIIDLEDFFSFDSVSETRPIGEDLPLNEINSQIYCPESFASEGEQSIKYFDNGIFEDGVLISAKKENKDIYTLKTQNIISLLNANDSQYNSTYAEIVEDWNSRTITAEEALQEINYNNDFVFFYPEWFSTYKLSPFLPPCSGRKILQQIAWATCCAIDTNYRNEITFIPFLNSDSTTQPDLIISNDDDRIIDSYVTEGEKYSEILWEYTKYTKGTQIEELGEIEPEYIGYEGAFGSYSGNLTLSEPFIVYDFNSASYSSDGGNPFSQFFYFNDVNIKNVRGYKYTPCKITEKISTGLKGNKTLKITEQTIYPIDTSSKKAQLQKWYSTNNTLNATVVDNDDIRLGKVIRLQLEDGSYFTGIITKLERTNISDYHTVRLEAHEWH